MNSAAVPKALREAWEWKDAVYRKTEGMTMSEALDHIHRDAEAMRRAFGLKVVEPTVGLAGVAEAGSEYGKKPEGKR